jgi:hypothetical protein
MIKINWVTIGQRLARIGAGIDRAEVGVRIGSPVVTLTGPCLSVGARGQPASRQPAFAFGAQRHPQHYPLPPRLG